MFEDVNDVPSTVSSTASYDAIANEEDIEGIERGLENISNEMKQWERDDSAFKRDKDEYGRQLKRDIENHGKYMEAMKKDFEEKKRNNETYLAASDNPYAGDPNPPKLMAKDNSSYVSAYKNNDPGLRIGNGVYQGVPLAAAMATGGASTGMSLAKFIPRSLEAYAAHRIGEESGKLLDSYNHEKLGNVARALGDLGAVYTLAKRPGPYKRITPASLVRRVGFGSGPGAGVAFAVDDITDKACEHGMDPETAWDISDGAEWYGYGLLGKPFWDNVPEAIKKGYNYYKDNFKNKK